MSFKLREFVEKNVCIKSASFLEIGAYENPTYLKEEVSIKYLDVQQKEDLIYDAIYNKQNINKIVDCDFIVPSNRYEKYINEQFDVIIADNVFEHVSNPIQWLITCEHLLKGKGSLLFIRLPEFRVIFDKFRSPTTFSHIVHDYLCNVPDLDPKHSVETEIYYSYGNPEDRYIEDRINIEKLLWAYNNPHFGIHCHCYEYKTFISKIIKPILFTGLVQFNILDHIQDTPYSFITILRKEISACPVNLSLKEFLG